MKKTFLFAPLLALSLISAAFGQTYTQAKRFALKSEVLGEERAIIVRTPPGYENSGQRYPVLYLTDGDAHIGHTSA